MIRANKNRIIKFRKQNEKESVTDNFVGFVADKEKKPKEPLNKTSNHKQKQICVNSSQPYSKRFQDEKTFTKLQQQEEMFSSRKKYLNEFEQFSDHEDHMLSSMKKGKQANVKLSMPKSYNPGQALSNIQQSLINNLKKNEPEIRLDEIFGLQITQEIMGMIPEQKRALQIRPMNNLSLDQSKKSKMIRQISNQNEFSQNHQPISMGNILNNSVKVDTKLENQTQKLSLPNQYKQFHSNFEPHNQTQISPQMFFFHSRVFQHKEYQFDDQNSQTFPNNQNKLFKGGQVLNQIDQNFEFLNDLGQIQDQQEHIQMRSNRYGLHQAHQYDSNYYQTVPKPKKIKNKYKIEAYNQLLPYQAKFNHEVSEQKHIFMGDKQNDQFYSYPPFQQQKYHSKRHFEVEKQEQSNFIESSNKRFQDFFENKPNEQNQFLSVQRNYDMLPPEMKQQFLNVSKKIKPMQKAFIPSQTISQPKHFIPVNQNYIDSNYDPRDQNLRGINKKTRM